MSVIHIYEHKKQLLKTMFKICSTSSNMWMWSYDHPPQDRFTRCALDAKYEEGGHFTPPPPTPPPGRVEPDISSLWMDLFSLDSVIFVVDFSDTYLMTNAENSVLELPNFKIFWGRIPPYPLTRLVPSALEIMSPPAPSPPYYKESSYGPGSSSQ